MRHPVFFRTAGGIGPHHHRALAATATGAIYYDVSGVPPTEAAMAPGGGGRVIQ